jgi:predicted nucleotide-binding protein
MISPVCPALDWDRAYLVLGRQFAAGERVIAAGADEVAYSRWVVDTKHWVARSFGESSSKISEFESAGVVGLERRPKAGSDLCPLRREGLVRQLNLLRVFANALKDMAAASRVVTTTPRPATRVFVISVSDDCESRAIAGFLKTLGLDPAILHADPRDGRNVLDSLEAGAEASFAVVLVPPLERARSTTALADARSDARSDEPAPRADRNVAFALGYALGRFGRQRVCALYRSPADQMQADLHGVVSVSLDLAGAWRLSMGRELKRVIPTIDLDDAT